MQPRLMFEAGIFTPWTALPYILERKERRRAAMGCGNGGFGGNWGCGNGGGGARLLGLFAVALGAGILIAAVFPVGVLMFLVAFLLIGCGFVCCRR